MKYVLGCHLGWMNGRRFCLQKGFRNFCSLGLLFEKQLVDLFL